MSDGADDENAPGDVFVVDDNPNNLGLLTAILREAGHSVRMANSGRRALAAVQRQPPDLILLDINMPEMNGYAVCEQLKRDVRTEHVPVIFLSALDDVRDKLSAFRLGGVDYITKPFQSEEVLARVASQIKLARLRRLLERRNRELALRNAELVAMQRSADQMFSTLSEVLPGTTLDGKYRIGEKIGTGGFAAVYRGLHVATGQPVAVKVLRPQPGDHADNLNERFRVEELSAIRIRHPSAVAVLDSGVSEAGVAYLVMELLRGRSLADELTASGPLSVERALPIFVPVCQALAEAHMAGVIHRDIKPANIFLHRSIDGAEPEAKVVDFGIAKLREEAGVDQATTMGRLLGTPVYMSPERLLGHAYDGGADVYGLAVTLYQTIAGRLPIALPEGGSLGALILACLNQAPRPLGELRPDLPPAVERMVMRALDKESRRRPTMAELASELSAAAWPDAPTGLGTPARAPDRAAAAEAETTLDSPLSTEEK
jgi:serine/threonine protein kinase